MYLCGRCNSQISERPCICMLGIPRQDNERSCKCVLGVASQEK